MHKRDPGANRRYAKNEVLVSYSSNLKRYNRRFQVNQARKKT